jgi:hypothetical protein
MDYLAWLQAHAGDLFAAVFGLHALAVAIVNLTPTPADDELVGKFYKAVEFLAGIFHYNAKMLPGEED